MQNFLVDTDVLIDFFQDRTHAKELIGDLANKANLYISILSITELRTGFTDNEAKTYLPKLYKLTKITYLTTEIAERAGKLRSKYLLKGISLATVDTLIAASAITNNYELVTRNTKHYPMPEIKFYNFKI